MPAQREQGARRRGGTWLIVAAAIAIGLACWWLIGRQSATRSDVGTQPTAGRPLSLVDAASLYSQRKTEHLHQRFERMEQRIKTAVECVRHPCASETKADALQQAEQAVSELDLATQHFVQPYRGVLAEEQTQLSSQPPKRSAATQLPADTP